MLSDTQASRIPVGGQGKQQRQIFTGRSLRHMHVHGMRAVEQRSECIRTERHGIGQTYGGPHRESAAHPLPNPEEVFFWQIHFAGGILVGRDHHHMTRAVLTRNAGFQKPLIDGCGVDCRFAGRKALG